MLGAIPTMNSALPPECRVQLRRSAAAKVHSANSRQVLSHVDSSQALEAQSRGIAYEQASPVRAVTGSRDNDVRWPIGAKG